MSSASIRASETSRRLPERSGDALMAGLFAMLVINVGQRLIGLGRNVGFCHYLSESELGLWALANSFIIIGAPIAVLGLPGSLGKFVEHYRLQGCLQSYLIRLTAVCAISVWLFSGVMITFSDEASQMLYGKSMDGSVIVWTAVTLVFVVLFNSTVELVMALRLVRLGSMLQLINTLVFTVLGIAGMAWFKHWLVLLPAYSIACLAAVVPGLVGVWREANADMSSAVPYPALTMWKRIFPFAAAMWCSNLLSNLFDLIDRYMVLHLAQASSEVGQALVGHFYCGRILPNLLLSLGLMLGGVMLPYLSADWERKLHGKISLTMNNMLVVLSLLFTGLAIGAQAFSPLLFNWFLAGRYQDAQDILSIGLIFACWSSLSTVAAAYLLCAERGKQYAFILALGLALNIGLNWPLIHAMGLYGAALATTITNGFVLLLILWRIHRHGCSIHRVTLLFSTLPLCLVCGPIIAGTMLMGLTVVCSRTNWILTDEDRVAIDRMVIPYLEKARLPVRTLWPV